jgi:hypothetical protein
MKMFKVILLGVMLVMFSSVSLARGGGGGGAGSGKGAGGAGGSGSAGDKTRDQTRDPATDQTGTKKQDRDRIHTPGTGTATPAAVPATN